MSTDMENVKLAKKSFNRILDNKKYSNIIRDDKHLYVLLNLLEDGNYRKILDIGTGTGYLAFPLAEKFITATVWGIDIADTIMEKNNEIVNEKNIPNLIFQPFDGLKYPFADESFDLIVSRYAFHHFPNITEAIHQMNKLLVKGGKVLISDPIKDENDERGIIDEYMSVKKDGHIQFYSLDRLNELFSNHGFVKEKQVLTDMKFPFAPMPEYMEVYEKHSEEERLMYKIENQNGVIWVKGIKVGNTVFVKQ